MASVTAITSGNWSSGSTWSTGSAPGSSDTVDLASYAVTLDTSATCNSITNSGGGNLNVGSSQSLSATLTAVNGTLVEIGSGFVLTYTGMADANPGAYVFSIQSGGSLIASGSTVTIGANTNTIPAASDVRHGVIVGTGTGTCYVPPAADVLSGIPVDATTGTLALTTTGHALQVDTNGYIKFAPGSFVPVPPRVG